MKKKRYVKPAMELIEIKHTGFICLSYAIKDIEDDSDYIVPPTIAGSGEWSENEGDGDIWGDLD